MCAHGCTIVIRCAQLLRSMCTMDNRPYSYLLAFMQEYCTLEELCHPFHTSKELQSAPCMLLSKATYRVQIESLLKCTCTATVIPKGNSPNLHVYTNYIPCCQQKKGTFPGDPDPQVRVCVYYVCVWRGVGFES